MSPRAPRPSSSLSNFIPAEAENLTSYVILQNQLRPLDWQAVFGNMAPVELEIGCGNGRFLALHAPANPDVNFFGIEISAKYAVLAAQRMAKRAVANVRISAAEAGQFLDDYVRPHSLRAIHIYFSDPWPKKRHARRRVFQYAFLDQLARALPRGGMVHVRTDVDWYFADILTLFAEHPGFDIVSYGRQMEFPEEELQMTGFESKALRQGRRVHYLNMVRTLEAAKEY